MKNSMRRNVLLTTIITALIFTMTLTGCNLGGTPENTDPVAGGELVLQLDEFYHDPLSLVGHELPIYDLTPVLYRGLLKYDENLKIVNDLAEELTANLEKKQLKLKLKENVVWEDGSAISFSDVQASYEAYSHTNYYGVWKDYSFNLVGTDKYRTKAADHISGITYDEESGVITFSFDELSTNALEFLTAPLLSNKGDPATPLLASGPYRLAERTGDGLTLVRNDNYGSDVFLDQIKITTSGDKASVGAFYGTPADKANEELKDRAVLASTGSSYFYLGFNLNLPTLKDQAVREAIAATINLDDLIKNQLAGYAKRPSSPIHEKSWIYTAGPKLIASKEAKNRLNSLNLEFELAYPDLPIYKLIADQIISDLAVNSVKVTAKAVPYVTYIEELYSKGDYDLFIGVQSYEHNPAKENYKWLARNDVLNNGYNAIHLNDAQSDSLLNEAYLIINSEDRKAKYQEWQQHFGGNFYIAPLLTLDTMLISQANYQIQQTNSLTPYSQIENWWYKAKLGKSKKK